ncbi:MAG: tetratricopeptide repeat protein, partial [Phycisphaerae bacterium]
DARINQVIRDVARASGDAVRLVDVERLFTEAAQAPGHIPGGDLFYDHCHMNINGNYRIARAILEEMEPLLPASIRQTSSSDRTIPDLRQCAKRLAFSGWDQLKINRDVLTAMERPPFTHRLDNAERIDLQRRQIATQQAFLTPEALQRYRAPYEQAIEQAPDDCTLRRNFASLLQALRDPSAAETQWRIVLNRFPEDAQAHIELGRSLVNQNKPKDGAEQYRLALASPYCDSRSRAIAHFNLAIALERLEQPADAIEHYRAAIRLSPTYEKAHVNLGLALRRQGEIDRALDHFKRAIEINPDFSPGHLNLALTLLGRERLEEAVSAFAEVSRIEPRNAMVHAAMGDTLVRLDRVDEAIAHFETVIQLAPGSAEAHHNLGIARMKQGDLSGAIEHFETALRLKPDFPDARANLEAARGKRELETRD